MTDGPKILTIDIETSPALGYFWDLYKPVFNLEQVIEHPRMLCFGAKWHHEKQVRFHAEWKTSHSDMVEAAHGYLDEADLVVTYNGDNFDIPHLNREFDEWHIKPPKPYTSVDLYRAVKKHERHLSHKLLNIARQKELTHRKLDSGGFGTWIGVLNEDEKAQRDMERYCKGDIPPTEDLFDNMLPHLRLPAFSLYNENTGDSLTCPVGHQNFQRRGYRKTRTRRYPQYQCMECGRWFSETRSSGSVSTS